MVNARFKLNGDVEAKELGCCEACFMAKGKQCSCRCGGRYHGLGRKAFSGSPRDDLVTKGGQKYLTEIQDLHCLICGESLEGQPIRQYPHSAGWIVEEFKQKQWLYIICSNCNYQNAIWKLGVSRDATV